MPGAGGQERRLGCEFGAFFACADGATPNDLIGRGIYSEIAVALKGGPWREVSMAMLAMAFGLSKGEAEAAADGEDVIVQAVSGAVGAALARRVSTVWNFGERSLSKSHARFTSVVASYRSVSFWKASPTAADKRSPTRFPSLRPPAPHSPSQHRSTETAATCSSTASEHEVASTSTGTAVDAHEHL